MEHGGNLALGKMEALRYVCHGIQAPVPPLEYIPLRLGQGAQKTVERLGSFLAGAGFLQTLPAGYTVPQLLQRQNDLSAAPLLRLLGAPAADG